MAVLLRLVRANSYIGIAFFIMIALFFSISQYKTKQMYKTHISHTLNTDIQHLIASIQDNNTLYNDILNAGKISKTQVNSLMWSNESIRDTILEYRELAVELNMRRDGFQYDQSSLNAIMIARLFYDWDKPYENELDSKTKVILSKAQELNAKWSFSNKNEMNRYSLSGPSWLELIENIEKGTLAYMTENHIENIEKIWLERTEVK